MPQPHHLDALAQVSFARFSASKSKPTTTFISSPLTGAQVEVRYWIQSAAIPTAMLEISLPLASATIGQNYIHAGLASVHWEMACAAVLVRIILTALRFDLKEIQQFIELATGEFLELTWHANTASTRARLNLQKRSANWFEQQATISSYHDIGVKDVDYRRKNGSPGLLVEFKTGDKLRQYGKYDQTAALSQKGKHRYAFSPELAACKPELLQAIESHVRNEVLINAKTLKSLGMLSLSTWSPETLRTALDAVWVQTGLANDTNPPTKTESSKSLGPEVMETLARYRAGDLNLKSDLPAATFSRHRKAISEFDGTDIAHQPLKRLVRSSSLRQLAYDRRWEPSGELRQVALCEVTGPQILLELNRGLAYLQNGELPDIAKNDLASWIEKWKKFAVRERFI